MSLASEQERTSSLWDQVYADIDGKQFPHEQLVKYLYFIQQHKVFDNLSALDIGFGTPANLLACHKLGYALSGIEVSQNSLDKTTKILSKLSIDFNGKLFHSPSIPFDDDTFSLVYSNQSIYYNLDFTQLVAETYRVLKPNGAFYHTFFTPNHWYFTHSERVSDGYVRWSDTHPTHQLRGMLLRHFDTKQELADSFSEFDDVRVDTLTTDLLGIKFELWIVTGKKPGIHSVESFNMNDHYANIRDRLSITNK